MVHNTSVNVSADFALLVRDDDGILSGCMGIVAPLFGSGSLTGFREDNNISFTVTSSIGTIAFVGRRKGSSITGTYLVKHDNGASEDGNFTLQKQNTSGASPDFNPAKCPTDAELHR
jgi:hypothetical protein